MELLFKGTSGDGGSRNVRCIVCGYVKISLRVVRRDAQVSNANGVGAITISRNKIDTARVIWRERAIIPKMVLVLSSGYLFSTVVEVSSWTIKIVMSLRGWIVCGKNVVDLATVSGKIGTVVQGIEPYSGRSVWFTTCAMSDDKFIIGIREDRCIGVSDGVGIGI